VGGGVAFAAAASLAVLTGAAISDIPNCDRYSGADLVRCNQDTSKFIVYASLFGAGAITFTVFSVVGLVQGASQGTTRVVIEGQREAASNGLRLVGAGIVPANEGALGSLRFAF
jgi:hypothetical protein